MPINSFLYPSKNVPTSYEVANSCRFEKGDDAYMHKSSSGGNRRAWTISFWVKRSLLGVEQQLFGGDSGSAPYASAQFDAGDTLQFYDYSGSGSNYTFRFITNQVFRDVSAWSHFVFKLDTEQSTESNRLKIYHNGTEITSFSTSTYPSEDADTSLNVAGQNFAVANLYDSGNEFSGYMSEFCLIDGSALAPTSFGEFDEDSPRIWKPKDVSGLTFGNNGFYLDFEDSSNLGNDANGGTDLTESNLAATDQATDTPTNNFCVINSLDNYYASSDFSEGNLKVSTDSSNYSFSRGTIGVSSGKWYFEHKIVTQVSDHLIGIVSKASTSTTDWIGATADTWGWITNGSNKSELSNNNSRTDVSSSGGYPTDGDIIGVYIDLDNNKLYFAKNGTLVSSTGQSLTAAASTTDGFYYPAAGDFTASVNVMEFNFGGGSVSAISSGNSDPNGYGNFEYSTTITGDGSSKSFYAICTKNLAEFG
jgi:hypothetical protein